MFKVALICYVTADHQVGAGHLVRSKALTESILFPHRLYVTGKGVLIKETFSNATYFNDTFSISDKIARLLVSNDYVMLLIDSPQVPHEVWGVEHERLLKITIDDYGGNHIRTDIIVNGNADSSSGYTGLSDWTLLLSGLKYLPIRPEFANVGNGRSINRTGRRVGFVIGSGADAQDWAEVILTLDINGNEWKDVIMVTSSSMPDFKKIKQSAKIKGISVVNGLNVNEMASFYSHCDVCVMTAGMCLYEALAAGTSVVAYPILSGMEKETAYFEKKKVIVNLGKKGFDPQTMTDTVNRLLDSAEERNQMYRMGRDLIDGKGVTRIAQVLMSVYSEVIKGLPKRKVLASIKKEIFSV